MNRLSCALAALVIVGTVSTTASAQNILVYGPGGTASTPHFPSGSTFTVADAATWGSMTAADFGGFDVIWIDDGACTGDPAIYNAAAANEAIWSSVVRGNVIISGADPDLHLVAGAQTYIANAAAWTGSSGATATGGMTGLYVSHGCTASGGFRADFLASIGTFAGTSGNFEPDSIDSAHPLMAGLTTGSLTWTQFAHTAYTTFPAEFTVVASSGANNLVLARARSPRVLVYGPSGSSSTSMFPGWGFDFDIADAATWAGMTQADYEQYDLIYFDGLCTAGSQYDTAIANQGVWSAAVTGRVYVSTSDPDYHVPIDTGAANVTENVITWTAGAGATAFGGRTGLAFHSGCTINNGIDVIGALSTALGTIVTTTSNTEATTIVDLAHPVSVDPNALIPGDFVWGFFCHGDMSTFPAGYSPYIECASGNNGSLVGEIGTCGDTSVSIGEDCDDGGESATCDTDCTAAACGDGTVNTTAGEACDGDGAGTGGETATCDTDCTAASCGDGNVNTTAGETCDGDGAGTGGETATCDTDCTAASCGDGVTNTTAGEECDLAGDSSTCDADCTAASCGDGTLNTAAGEACDDGTDNSDTVADACRTDCSAASCGDGVQDTGEACDDGTGNGPGNACLADCTLGGGGGGDAGPGAPDAGDGGGGSDDGGGCCSVASNPKVPMKGTLVLLLMAVLVLRRQLRPRKRN